MRNILLFHGAGRSFAAHSHSSSNPVGRQAVGTFRNLTAGSKRIDVSKLQMVQSASLKPKPPVDKNLLFGKYFTDHMLEIVWGADTGFGAPKISPHHNLSIDPAAPSLQYAVQCFEGLALPTFHGQDFLECIKELLRIDHAWIPEMDGFSLYLRPTCIAISSSLGVQPATNALFYAIACPVGPYFKDGFAPVKILAENSYCRAWAGGTGANKVGGNYALGLLPQRLASAKGCSQVLWLAGEEQYVTEVGAMNIFFLWKDESGQTELVTAPLNGLILPGVTRASILELTRHWGEFKVTERQFTMGEVAKAAAEGRLLECFGAGTAAVVAPVDGISYNDSDIKIPCGETGRAGPLCVRLYKAMCDIHYGRAEMKDWSVVVDP